MENRFSPGQPGLERALIFRYAWQIKPGRRSGTFTQFFVNVSAEPFTDLNPIGWAQANREAGSFCYSQGYVSGHFDGNQVAGSSYGVLSRPRLKSLQHRVTLLVYCASDPTMDVVGRAMRTKPMIPSEVIGTALPPRNFTISIEQRMTALVAGVPAYMARKRRIEDLEEKLIEALSELSPGQPLPRNFERELRKVNVLIADHNRYYPLESNLPIDVKTGQLLDVDGEPWKPLPETTVASLAERVAELEDSESLTEMDRALSPLVRKKEPTA
jgi:hypothetical protein